MKESGVSIAKTASSCYLFVDFRRLVNEVASESKPGRKIEILKSWLTRGANNREFKGDLHLWCKLLIPQTLNKDCRIQNKQLIKIFSELFNIDHKEISDFVRSNDVSTAIKYYFENNEEYSPADFSSLTVREVDNFLEEMYSSSGLALRMELFKAILPACTGNDLKVLIRLIKRNLQINLGPKQLLEALHPSAYKTFKSCKDLHKVIQNLVGESQEDITNDFLMTPISPMLSEPCRSIDQAMDKCPNGLFAEIKYDGERTQVHKKGLELQFFSRNLKPTNPQKLLGLSDSILQAFQNVDEVIIDSELVSVDTTMEESVSISSISKRNKDHKNTNICLVVFDCIYVDGVILTNAPLKKRRKILEETIVEIRNTVILSEKEYIQSKTELSNVIAKALTAGIEGLILKDVSGTYVPGKRHWLKIKKEYLYEGKLADSADLIVLGAWFGSGKHTNLMDNFLMGCFDEDHQLFVTVTQVKNGISEETLLQIQNEMDMIQINQDPAKSPDWLYCSNSMLPDFVAKDPRHQPIWEITGAEFTQHEIHTADGISLRFPKVTRFRSDKNWENATNLNELRVLVTMSNKKSVFQMLKGGSSKSSRERDDVGRKRAYDIFECYKNKKRK